MTAYYTYFIVNAWKCNDIYIYDYNNLVLSANQDRNGCDDSRNRFFVDTPTQACLQLVASARKRLHPQGAVAALIEQLPHIQDARANASESCPQSLLKSNCITK